MGITPVGFVLDWRPAAYEDGKETDGQILGMDIHGFGLKGLFLAPGKSPRRYQLAKGFFRGLREVFGSQTGQGQLGLGWFDRAGTDPTLLKEDLTGGFMCKGEPSAAAVAHRCRFRLLSPFVFAFAITPWREAEEPEDGRRPWELRHMATAREELLQTGVWYPVELSVEGTEVVYDHRSANTEGLFFGAFRLADLRPDGEGKGELRFVHLGDWNPAVRRVRLHRFGRLVGEAEWDD